MRRGHVLCNGGMVATLGVSGVGGDSFTATIDLHRGCRVTNVDFLAAKLKRHRVVVPLDFDVIVNVDAGCLSVPEDEAFCWERK